MHSSLLYANFVNVMSLAVFAANKPFIYWVFMRMNGVCTGMGNFFIKFRARKV